MAPEVPIKVWAKFNDIPEEQRTEVDDFIDILGVVKQTGESVKSPGVRKAFVNRYVFADDWDVTETVGDPQLLIGKRSGRSWNLKCGATKADLPASSSKQAREPTPGFAYFTPSNQRRPHGRVSEARRHTAPIYLKPSVEMDIDWISFLFVDARHARVAARNVELFEEYQSWTEVKQEAMKRWDRAEAKYVGDFNMGLAVYWARKRLKRSFLCLRNMEGDRELLTRIREYEDFELFVVLRTCRSVWEAGKQMYDEEAGSMPATRFFTIKPAQVSVCVYYDSVQTVANTLPLNRFKMTATKGHTAEELPGDSEIGEGLMGELYLRLVIVVEERFEMRVDDHLLMPLHFAPA